METLELDDEGFIDHTGHRVWWGSVGNATFGPPLLTVHGGPGICHDCLEPLAGLVDERRVVFFDSFGCGRSDRADDPGEYTVELFLDELQAVRDQLGLGECHLFAHSYGGPVALEYLLRRAPDGVRSLILSNSFASSPALTDGGQCRLDDLPAEDAAVLRNPVGADPDPGEPPEPLMRSQMNSGAEVYQRMHGSSWFTPDGEWAGWDAVPRLPGLRLPTLVVGGTRDQCVPELAEQMHAAIPGSELAVLYAAPLPFFEVPAEYLATLRAFLRRAERVQV